MALEDIFSYFRTYDKASFAVFACSGNEPSEADIAAIETEIGFRLPDDFREFTMSPLGGLYMEVRENLWPRHKPYDVGPFWSFLYGLKVFGIASDIPEWLDLRRAYQELRSEGYPDLVPFLQRVGDANRYCFRAAVASLSGTMSSPINGNASTWILRHSLCGKSAILKTVKIENCEGKTDASNHASLFHRPPTPR